MWTEEGDQDRREHGLLQLRTETNNCTEDYHTQTYHPMAADYATQVRCYLHA